MILFLGGIKLQSAIENLKLYGFSNSRCRRESGIPALSEDKVKNICF